MFDKLRRIVRPIVGSQLFIFITGFLLFSWLYLFKLGTLTKGLSQAEVSAVADSSSVANIVDNPVYAPHKLLQLGLRHAFGYHAWNLRLASVFFAAIFLICLYFLCVRWFGRLIATVSTLLLAATPWVSLLGRHATPSIMLLIAALILGSYYWLARAKKYLGLSWLFFCFCIGAGLYVPGMIWILLVGALINRRSLIFSLKRLGAWRLLGGGLLVSIMLIPLILAFVKTPSLMYHWTLIPASWIGFGAFFKNLGWAASSLVLRTRYHIEWLVGRMPLLTILSSALALFGAYAMSLQARQKLYAIIGLIIFGCLATAANGSFLYLTFCLVPLILLTAAGLRFLFLQWQAVFPRNPLPRYLAYSLIILLAVGQVAFGARATLFAWPNTSETKTIFVLK